MSLLFQYLTVLTVILNCFSIGVYSKNPCVAKDYGKGSFVCVCNATYCDTFDPIVKTNLDTITIFESGKNGKRFAKSTHAFTPKMDILTHEEALPNSIAQKKVSINRNVSYQKIIGFGGAFTDASGINILSLPPPMPERIIKEYYSKEGLNYNIGRVPIGGSDFSTHKYTYDDTPGDIRLSNFSLADEDIKYKIPLIKVANRFHQLSTASSELKLFGSPWSAPAWMKTNNNISGKGTLKGQPGGEYFKAWANYFVKFLDAYKSKGLSLWGITGQNEPIDGEIKDFPFNCMGFTSALMRDFIKLDLGPTLEKAGYGPDKLALMIMDDQKVFIKNWTDTILGDANAMKYVSGIGFHWYLNKVTPANIVDPIYAKYPKHFLLATEACEGASPFDKEKVSLGNWDRAENYANDIMTDLQHFTAGWVDWNLALDVKGGPNWANNFVDAPVIINATAKEYYRQPMFYALAHFSKFISRDSKRVDIKEEGNQNLQLVAFDTPENATVLIALNKKSEDIPFEINDPLKKGSFKTVVPAHSMQSYIWYKS